MDFSKLLSVKSIPEALQVLTELLGNFQFDKKGSVELQTENKNYFFSLENGLKILENVANPDLKVKVSENDFLSLLKGQLNPFLAGLLGKVKLDGDKSLLTQLTKLIKF